MNKRLEYLRRRRKLLVAQAAAQRSEVAVIKADLTTVSATMMLPAPKNRLLRWGSRIFTVWEVFSLVRKQWVTIKKTRQ